MELLLQACKMPTIEPSRKRLHTRNVIWITEKATLPNFGLMYRHYLEEQFVHNNYRVKVSKFREESNDMLALAASWRNHR
jgi:hypothetical protein